MHLYPSDLFTKLEFDKILERLSAFCMGLPAKQKVAGIQVFSPLDKVDNLLNEVVEFRLSLENKAGFPHHRYESIAEELLLLQKIDFVLEQEAYLKFYHYLLNMVAITDFFNKEDNATTYPLLFGVSQQIQIDNSLIENFERIFDEEGAIKPTASPELARIFRAIRSKEQELESVFKRLATKYRDSGFLTDNIESFKNSRRVLSVNAEHKRKIKGVIHDESGTGKTVFIEPQEVTPVNNDLFELEVKKKHEVYRILKELSRTLREYIPEFDLWQKILIRLDMIAAKAKFSLTYNGQKPKLNADKKLIVKQMYHPLLYLINKEAEKETVPLSMHLNQKERMLVISGPNAGGKSVSLKAIGLNQLMLQSGMLIPVDSDSDFAIFNKIMIDIGDQQSLEGDLSTYSSRLLHMQYFTQHAGGRSLVLMDEFGSGSDPRMGGAIAEAVLDTLVKKQCFGVITTHYSNIKNYAFNSPSILNGAMLFDKEHLQPLYELKVGQPGSSFAFEIANKIGLSPEVLQYAQKKAGQENKAVDQMLVELQHEKQILEEKLDNLVKERKQLHKLIGNYEEMKGELDIRRKKLKLEAKEKSYLNFSDYERELQKLIRDLRKNRDLEKAEKKLQELKQKKKSANREIKQLSGQVYEKELAKVKNLKVGQYVKLRNGSDAGKVVDFDDKKVKIQMGSMHFEVPRSDIFLANAPIERKGSSINTDTSVNPHALEQQLDIRGYTKMDAQETIQEFLDNALLGSATQLKITHGKGSGVLRKTLWEKAREYKDIKKIWHPEEEFGGQGVTYISF